MNTAGRTRWWLLVATLLLAFPAPYSATRVQNRPSPTAAERAAVTFAQDIAPIVYSRCASCHRPEGIAPFSLLSYQDVSSRASQVVAAVRTREMPPWKPEPGYGAFQGERRLSDAEISRIEEWVSAGAPAGDLSQAPPLVSVQAARPPDLVVTMAEAFRLPADGHDVFRNFVVPVPLAGRRYVRAWEFRPGNAAVVHHATVGFDATTSSRELDGQDPAPGYEGVVSFSAQNPAGYFLGWSPGQEQPQRAAPGMAWRLDSGGDVLFSMHLRPTGRAETVRASIALYFTDEAPERIPLMLRLGRQDIDIPAGAARHVITNSYRLPVDVDLLSVYPHAHHLAREIRAFATLPGGVRRELLYIRDWDFNWQDVYRYAAPVKLPAGSVLTMECTYDNSAGNPHAVHRPPVRVTFGPNGTDEMGDLWLQVVTRDPAQRATLEADFERKLQPETIAGLEMMLRSDPGNLGMHNDVGLLYQQIGRLDDARAHFGRALRLAPDSAAALNNLGSVLLGLGNVGEARPYFERALARDPTHAAAHYNLGLTRHLVGDRSGAIAAYRRAIEMRPAYAEAHHLLGSALAAGGTLREGWQEYREAIRLRPEWAVPLIELGWSLATARASTEEDWREAVRVGERAAALTAPPAVSALDVLAAAHARSGDFARALAMASVAQTRATATGNRQLASEIARRVELYRQMQPYVQPD